MFFKDSKIKREKRALQEALMLAVVELRSETRDDDRVHRITQTLIQSLREDRKPK